MELHTTAIDWRMGVGEGVAMKSLRCGILLIAVVCLGSATIQAADTWYTDLNKARAEAQHLNRPILLHFGAIWCAPCQQMERTVLSKSSVLSQIHASVIPVKIDVDDHPELVKRFGVERFPTDIIIEPSGERLLETTGMHTDKEYIALINRAGSRYADLLASRVPAAQNPINNSPENGTSQTQPVKQSAPVLALEGYCPVTLWKNRRWEKGSQQFISEHNGLIVHLSSAELIKDFEQNPDRYLPKFLGCDPVIVWETDRAVPGNTRFAAFYDEELFLFTDAENRKEFKATPDKFLRTRVVLHLDQLETVVR